MNDEFNPDYYRFLKKEFTKVHKKIQHYESRRELTKNKVKLSSYRVELSHAYNSIIQYLHKFYDKSNPNGKTTLDEYATEFRVKTDF